LIQSLKKTSKVLESLGFWGKISMPLEVLENDFGSGKSWNFLGYDVGGGYNDAVVFSFRGFFTP